MDVRKSGCRGAHSWAEFFSLSRERLRQMSPDWDQGKPNWEEEKAVKILTLE